jgi:hypothetical protein
MKGRGNGTFDPEQVIYTTDDVIFAWPVLRASHSSKPDLTVYQSPVFQSSPSTPQQLVLVNTTSSKFPSCTPPNFRPTGISVCGPSSTLLPSSPVHFSFAGSNEVPGLDMQIWVDGKKVAESLKHTYASHDFVDARVPLSTGQHRVDIYSVAWDYMVLWNSFGVIVGESVCPIPNAGLNICSPINDTQLSSPIAVYATSHGNNGWAISRMEIWVDGVKMYSTFGEETLKTELTLNPGWHLLTYYAIGTDGSKWRRDIWTEIK